MRKKKQRFPTYATVIGEDTEVAGGIRFAGALHVDGKVTGDIKGLSDSDCALTLGRSGTIEGRIDVAHVVLDGTVIGDVRASSRAELASGARVEGTIYYCVLEMAEGAEVNGKLLHMSADQTPQLVYRGIDEGKAESGAPDSAAARSEGFAGDGGDAEQQVRRVGDNT